MRSLTLKSKIFNFDKIWQKIKIPPRWFIITLRFHQNSKVKIFQNLSQYGRTIRYKIFSKFWSRYQNHQNLQNWLSSPKFWRKFLKLGVVSSLATMPLGSPQRPCSSKNPLRLRRIFSEDGHEALSSSCVIHKTKIAPGAAINYIFSRQNCDNKNCVDPSPKLRNGVGIFCKFPSALGESDQMHRNRRIFCWGNPWALSACNTIIREENLKPTKNLWYSEFFGQNLRKFENFAKLTNLQNLKSLTLGRHKIWNR